jgi:hypothetical protein
MMLPYHTSDYRALPNEEAARAAMRPLNMAPGDYYVPRPATPNDMRTPEYAQKLSEGPVLIMTVLPNGTPKMGGQLAQWFLYCVLVGVFAAYVATRAVPATAGYLEVFRFTGVTAFACYAIALMQDSIWYKRAWSTTFKFMFDGLIYAALTAGMFGWLWPR